MFHSNQEEKKSPESPPYVAERVENVVELERQQGGEPESASPQMRDNGEDSGVGGIRNETKRGVQHAVGSILGGFRNSGVRQFFNTAVGFLIGKPVQTSLVVLNIFLVKTALTALKRARFAASVRVVKDLKRADDLRYLLGQLPPWISSPEWEAGKPVQELLGLLWPALNSTICLALKNVIEDRMQSSAEYGHIKFSRFSLGRNPPVICGIKAVPLHEEDLLALVVDVDLRWAGEPDVVLRLTKMSRASLGLKNLQVSAMETFLGRYKLPNPRIGLVTPKDSEDGVPQMMLTKVQEKTLAPVWHHSRVFVIGSESQPLRFLLSHRRVENFFGADMPLGSAEVDVSDLLMLCADNASGKSFKSCLSGKSSLKETDTDEFESASSTPVHLSPTKRVAWASPSIDAGPHADAQNELIEPRACGTNPLADMLLESDESSNSIESRVFAAKNRMGMALRAHGLHQPRLFLGSSNQKAKQNLQASEGLKRRHQNHASRTRASKDQRGLTSTHRREPRTIFICHSNTVCKGQGLIQVDSHRSVATATSPKGRKRLTDQNYGRVLGIRVGFTKIDYGDSPPNPVLSFSVVRGPAQQVDQSQSGLYSMLQRTTASQNSLGNHRVFSTDCQSGSRPGVLHWGGQVFHVPVWDAENARVRVELGNISSSLKLSSYGTELFLLEASSGSSFDDDVEVEASANIPLKPVLTKGVVEGNYRLREAKTEKLAGVNDEQRLDIGRIVLTMSWFPFSST
eukprot:jgi/Picre1/31146/NNA_006500.t1